MGIPIFIGKYIGGKLLDAVSVWLTHNLLNRIRRRGYSELARAIAHGFDVFSSARLKPQSFSIKTIGRIYKREVDEIMDAWAGGLDGIMLVGDAGSGKSGIAHHQGRSLQITGYPVLFIDATEVPPSRDPSTFLRNLLPIERPLVDAFDLLGKEQDCYFIVDQLDSITETEVLQSFVSLIKVLIALPGVRVLVVSRTYEANTEANIKDLDLMRISCDELSKGSTLHYLSKLGIVAPSTFMQKLAKNLLNLSLISEIVDANGSFEGVDSETELWVRFADTIKDREGEAVLKRAFEIASETHKDTKNEFTAGIIPGREIRRLQSRGILISPSLFRFRFRHERLKEFLCAYGLFPVRPSALDIYNEYGELKGKRIVQWLHSLLHLYDKEGEARFVSEILATEKEGLTFYSRVIALDVLKEQNNPSQLIAEIITEYLRNEVYDKYFFTDLDNPSWIPLLHESGYFHHPPEPSEVQPGSFKYPWWFGGAYLSSFASEFPAIVVDVSSSIQSENGYALDKLLDALLQIPASLGAGSANNIARWVPILGGWFDPVKLGKLMGYIADGGHLPEALFLLEALFTPLIPTEEVTEDRKRLRLFGTKSKVEDYWLEQIWNNYGVRLISKSPVDVAEVLERNLIESIELEQEQYGILKGETSHSSWRSAVEDHPQNTSLHKLNDLLVNGLRDAVMQICVDEPGEGEHLLNRYLSSHHSILRRIGLHSLRQFGSQYPYLLDGVFQERDVLNDSDVHHELHGLLTNQFLNLESEAKQRIIEWLFVGPEDTGPVSAWIKEREGEEKHDEELIRYKDWWTIRRMWAIRQHLDGKDKDRFEELVNKYDEPDHPDFLSWSSSFRKISNISPKTKDELLKLSYEDILSVIKQYRPTSPSFEHNREGLAEALKAAVSEAPENFVNLGPRLSDIEVRFVYTYHYLMGINEVVRRGEELELDPILELCMHVVSTEDDPFEQDRDHYEQGLKAAQFEVANLVESLLEKDRPDFENKKIESIKKLTSFLLENPDPAPESEIQSGWDPASYSLNCVRGKAMHDLIHLARYLDKKARQEKGEEEHQPQLDPFVKNKLEEKLDKTQDKSLSVHSIYGWYTPLLEYFDKEWLSTHLNQIFPDDPEMEKYWHAAWGAYISFNRVYKEVFSKLFPQYRRAISYLHEDADPGRIGVTKGEQLAVHLTYAYIHQIIDLHSEDGLYASFFDEADDKVRGHVAFWLVKAFGELNLRLNDPVWQRMWELMQWRISVASKSKNIEDFQDEVSAYMRWLEHAPVEFGEVESVIRQAVPFLKEGYHKKLVIDYLAENCEKFPQETIEILRHVLQREERGWFTLHEEGVAKIFEAVKASENESAKEEAILLINFLGERGDFQWKKYLPAE